MQPSTLFATLSLSLFLAAPTPTTVAAALPWEKDYDAAAKKAKATGKTVMIDFWAEWCTWCHELDRTTYADARVVEQAAGFIPVKVDTEGKPKERALSDRYDVTTLPTILFVSPEGRVVLRMQGFQAPEKFSGTLEKARLAAAEVRTWDTRLAANSKDPQALSLLGQHLFTQGMTAESFDLLSRAVRLDAQTIPAERKRARLMLAILQAQKERYGPATEAWQEALSLPPAGQLDAPLMLELERAFVQGDQVDAAHKVLKEIASCCAQTPYALQGRSLLGMTADAQ